MTGIAYSRRDRTSEVERKKLAVEVELRNREIAIKERELQIKDAELAIKNKEFARSGWMNPLVIAILTGAVALLGATIANLTNVYIERTKVQETRLNEHRKNYRIAIADYSAALSTAVQKQGLLMLNVQRGLARFSQRGFEAYDKELNPIREKMIVALFNVGAFGAKSFELAHELYLAFDNLDVRIGSMEGRFGSTPPDARVAEAKAISTDITRLYEKIAPARAQLIRLEP